MPVVRITFTKETFDDLLSFIVRKHGVKEAMSITVEQAVKEYLERQKQGGAQ